MEVLLIISFFVFFPQRCEDEWLGMPSPIPVKRIYYLNLLKDVFGLEE